MSRSNRLPSFILSVATAVLFKTFKNTKLTCAKSPKGPHLKKRIKEKYSLCKLPAALII